MSLRNDSDLIFITADSLSELQHLAQLMAYLVSNAAIWLEPHNRQLSCSGKARRLASHNGQAANSIQFGQCNDVFGYVIPHQRTLQPSEVLHGTGTHTDCVIVIM